MPRGAAIFYPCIGRLLQELPDTQVLPAPHRTKVQFQDYPSAGSVRQ